MRNTLLGLERLQITLAAWLRAATRRFRGGRWIDQEREKLIRELEIKNRESETLRRSLASLVGTFEFNEIISRILTEIRHVIPYDTASVWRVEEDFQYIRAGVDCHPK